MITMSEDARKELDAFFVSHPEMNKSIRIYLAPGGCCGPRLTMALDEANDQDVTETLEGMTFCMARELSEKTGEMSLDVSYMGFTLTPEHPLEMGGGCSSCGGSCGSGGCH